MWEPSIHTPVVREETNDALRGYECQKHSLTLHMKRAELETKTKLYLKYK